jgi:hypothetical protein
MCAQDYYERMTPFMVRVFSAQERPGAATRGTSSPDNVRQHVTADMYR